MKNPTVSKIDFGCFDLPFFNISNPGLKLAHHESTAQNVQITTYRSIGNPERLPDFRGVEHLTVIMSQHGPKSSQSYSRNTNTQGWNISFEKCRNILLPPVDAVFDGFHQIRNGKAAMEPELLDIGYLIDRKRGNLKVGDSSSQGFG